MKRILFLAICVMLQPILQAQSVTQGVATNANYSIGKRGPNWRVWQNVTYRTNQAGSVRPVTNSYTEVAANLCVQDASGNWSDSDGTLSIVADGASSGNSPVAVHFAGDAGAAGGTVNLTAPDGKVFVSRVFGISYYDPTVPTIS